MALSSWFLFAVFAALWIGVSSASDCRKTDQPFQSELDATILGMDSVLFEYFSMHREEDGFETEIANLPLRAVVACEQLQLTNCSAFFNLWTTKSPGPTGQFTETMRAKMHQRHGTGDLFEMFKAGSSFATLALLVSSYYGVPATDENYRIAIEEETLSLAIHFLLLGDRFPLLEALTRLHFASSLGRLLQVDRGNPALLWQTAFHSAKLLFGIMHWFQDCSVRASYQPDKVYESLNDLCFEREPNEFVRFVTNGMDSNGEFRMSK